MSDIAVKENTAMAAETGTVRGGNSTLTDLVMGGMDVQLSPFLQDGSNYTANDRARSYRDRILKAAGRSKGTV